MTSTDNKSTGTGSGKPLWRLRTFLTWLRASTVVVTIAMVGVIAGTIASVAPGLPNTDSLDAWVPNQTTRIYAADGQLLAKLYVENREFVSITDIPIQMQQATIAVEDERFYNHVGADPKAILRAIVNNIRSQDPYAQGASTITEQLAKNIYLSQKKTFARRLQQMLMALKIERHYSKEEILEMYLNEVCYGSGTFGVQAAAKVYFNKPVKDLTMGEMALLAGLPRRPSHYSPFDNFDAARGRQKLVLTKMAEQGYISWDEATAASEEELKLAPRQDPSARTFKKPYFVTHAIRELVSRYGVDMAYKGGLQVYTTMDLDLQNAAEKAAKKGLNNVKRHRVSQVALVCISVKDGRILAMVGGTDFEKSQWNRATQARRQPGSSFKPYVYATAIDQGFTPNSVVRDSPVSYPGAGGRPWRPQNYDGRYRGSVTLRTAVALSINIVAVKVMNEVGVEKVIQTARRMGIRSPLAPYLPLALGASGITLLEHTAAYAAFASNGLRAEPTTISKVLDHTGSPIEVLVPRVRRVLLPQTAAAVRSMLITAVESGTGRQARIKGYQVAGKTGTTSGGKDAWFMGFTPDLVCGVWMGNDDNTPMSRPSGGGFCGPVWKTFMVEALDLTRSQQKRFDDSPVGSLVAKRRTEGDSGKSHTVTLCAESGLLATDDCPQVTSEEFPAGKGPKRHCTIHTIRPTQSVQEEYVTVCAESGKLATENCPSPILRSFGVADVPTGRCPLHGSYGAARRFAPVGGSKGTSPKSTSSQPETAVTMPETRPVTSLPPPVIPGESGAP
ncbi:MAG: penicillin-binding protein [Armatimonadetes bacterium CG_4_10_14_3_um_filter_59_10]|nr:MAG: penicillin-binding protein [Armatimonadetes bacterium CG_4_8_14_3_um_filter_58_9]PIY37159.1 MAG: penicillin-binding protein [Armatimonadetes bacterium CG_4_10_14_3_um_filter_59_10]PJB63802.1 MAG: penicillin-binding protein [Armatimonadetes bacterium CG_4_9_14_3_um_filter_58_7]